MPLLDFEIVREGWTIVELEDKTIIRMRPVLLFVRKDIPRSRKSRVKEGLRLNLQFGVWGLKKGRPSKKPVDAELIRQNVVKRNLSFRFLRRGDSLYRTERGDLRVVVTPTQFDKSRLFDQDGEPLYLVVHELSAALAAKAERSRG